MIAGTSGQIRELWIYPVKGCRGIRLETSSLGQRGLEGDRRWMIVDDRGHFLTQREEPRLALAVPRLGPDTLHLALDGASSLALPRDDRGERLSVRIWRDEVSALAPDASADRALSRWLGRSVRIVRFPDDSIRPCDPSYAPQDSHTAFADGYPVLIVSEDSLAGLNAALRDQSAGPMPMTRFRPSIVVGGFLMGAEDESDELVVDGRVRLRLVKRCDRCVVTTVDQATGERTGKEPLTTLLRIRRNDRTGGGWFGQNAVPLLQGAASASLQVGAACAFHQAPRPYEPRHADLETTRPLAR